MAVSELLAAISPIGAVQVNFRQKGIVLDFAKLRWVSSRLLLIVSGKRSLEQSFLACRVPMCCALIFAKANRDVESYREEKCSHTSCAGELSVSKACCRANPGESAILCRRY